MKCCPLAVVNQLKGKDRGQSVLNSHSKNLSFSFFHESFLARKSLRQFPLLLAMHRCIDGALLGVVIAVAIMSTIALHAQYLWTISFSRLESTRDLSDKLIESTSILEGYLLKDSILPKYMVSTKSKDLIYLERPKLNEIILKDESENLSLYKKLFSYPVNNGY